MSPAKKKTTSASASSFSKLRSLFAGWGKYAFLGLILLGVLGAGGYAIWKFVQEKVLPTEDYRLTAEKIRILPWPPPVYVKPDPRYKVFERLQQHNQMQHRGPVSIMEDDLAERITAAFEQNPWIAKLRSPIQKKFPATIQVEVEYRVPVMMVEVTGKPYAVDAQGISLPTRDCFTTPEIAKYPRLIGVDMPPTAAVGTRWGDSRVLGGVEIAAALSPVWEKLHLKRIEPRAVSATASGISAGPMQSPNSPNTNLSLCSRHRRGKTDCLGKVAVRQEFPGTPARRKS